MAPLGCVQILGESHSVAVVDRSRISIPLNEVGGSCPTVGSSSAGMDTAGVTVIRGRLVVLTTVAVGPLLGTPVRLAVDAPTKVPDAYRLP
jgi:hypothetical protein